MQTMFQDNGALEQTASPTNQVPSPSIRRTPTGTRAEPLELERTPWRHSWRFHQLTVASMLAAALGLGGCASWFGKDEVVDPPAELVDFDEEIEVEELWSRNVGAGVSEYYLKLRPLVEESRVFAAERKGGVRA